ncbi:MAG: hypothetical protein ABIO60_07615 [Aquaticitalea sp.]
MILLNYGKLTICSQILTDGVYGFFPVHSFDFVPVLFNESKRCGLRILEEVKLHFYSFCFYFPFIFRRFSNFKDENITIEAQSILFQNYLFLSKVKEVKFKEFDYYKIVNEESRNGILEAVWSIKGGRLADTFSTFQCSNYKALKSALKLKYKGE